MKSQGLPGGKEVMVCEFDIEKRPISLHIPLHRLLAGFLQTAAEIDRLETLISRESLPRNFLEMLIEHPLRIQALCAQAQAKLWVRNGNSLLHQVYLYRHKGSFYDDGFDYDILILQALCILLGPDAFLTILAKRFKLQHLFLMPSVSSLFETSVLDPVVIYEALKLMINIVTHRPKCGMSLEDCIRREIVHALAASDLTHSSLQSAMCTRLSGSDKFDKVLKEVAEFSNASVCTEGCYTLKADSWDLYDPYFPRYTAREHQQAQDRYVQHLKSSNKMHEGMLPPPILFPAFNSFGKTVNMLWCPSMLFIQYITLFKRSTNLINDSSLCAVLHILILAADMAPIIPDKFVSSSERGRDPFSHDSFDQNIGDPHSLPGGSLLSQLIQLWSSEQLEEPLRADVTKLLKKLAERCPNNGKVINERINIPKEKPKETDDKESMKEQARKRQQEILKNFTAQQEQFLRDSGQEDLDMELMEDQCYDCVLCRDSSSLQQSLDENRPFGPAGFIQKSNLLRAVREKEFRAPKGDVDLLTVDINETEQAKEEEETLEGAW
eukprot:CAMPEP_0206186470 /NCGR_PEP_ID=MMETSP0166-20121206/2420_1 /ASSEMBLY_ACC=CAM_ASM_000260 /TAXON_ID=95228 /ORGANISM="Vannella robusta, Strain DIVA3 518/3/11/1/6" /LENGTH=551 /DNA_ID=CAMNT_0053601857 /DNA_START=1541 /DNA_END=3193 /DNA_ORIENTATION=+